MDEIKKLLAAMMADIVAHAAGIEAALNLIPGVGGTIASTVAEVAIGAVEAEEAATPPAAS